MRLTRRGRSGSWLVVAGNEQKEGYGDNGDSIHARIVANAGRTVGSTIDVVEAFDLTSTEARVLGSLIEKDITTPDYYPLSLNALMNACNQKSNREPVMELGEEDVRQALAGLQTKRLAGPASGADSRVTKYEHRLQEVLNLNRRETALLCVLLLRGPQTPGELRGRSERLFQFESIEDVQSTLQRMIERDPPLARSLPRQPGTKEVRYVQLMTPADQAIEAAPAPAKTTHDDDRVHRLEQEVSDLRQRIGELEQQLASFRRQFE